MARRAAASPRPARRPKAGRSRRRRSTGRAPRRAAFQPAAVFLIFAAVGLGAWSMAQETRLLVLWGVLLVGSLILGARRPGRVGYSLAELIRGAVIGFVVGIPIVMLAPDTLAATASRLHGAARPEQLLLRLVLLAPVVEGIYFRGFLQPNVGVGMAALLYGLAGLILFLPVAVGFPAVLSVVVVAMAVLGLIYGAVAARFGAPASIACQATLSLSLWVLPRLLQPLSQLPS